MAISGDLFIDPAWAASTYARTSEAASIIETFLTMAQGIVIDRLERATTDTAVLAIISGWDEDSVPEAIRAAVLTQFLEIYGFFRGDEQVELKTTGQNRLSDRVERFLGPWLERPFA